ncbi:glycosyltransferase involved in cell wall biosynthesis [Anseongella ginsenosidimutans]|uniref:Glycosyltransferase involved in cell wall biosynthesis n=1 Tax=Anseongella ginsenosidimutans TaxID=496056 RepID=A0A4R3KNW0_9SPHI|nr:glycosyltransferase [Anseongella ginsenosidimutans]QEC52118.1 glycosyltransferase [Anseongella ginsenosidimutans]TCS84853.1 glycosyltransferase involved in cell wall biosynthesis [Anseongella ginsenosidimutans]
MKILQVIPNLYSGGAERFVVDLSNQLALKSEVKVLLFSHPELPGNLLLSKQISEHVAIAYVDKKRGLDTGVFSKIRKQINKFRPDVIHTHVGAFKYLAPLLWIGGHKAVHTVHSDAFREALDIKGLWYRRLMFRNRNVVPVTISKESTRSFLNAYPGIYSKMIYNGRTPPVRSAQFEAVRREVDSYKETKNTRVFLFVGRLDHAKNPLMLFKAFERLRASGADAQLLLIGRCAETSYGERVADLLRSNTSNNCIRYLGEKENVNDYLAAVDFFCLSSIYEGMPISLIEAFAAGCVPVCTPVGGIPEMVGRAGFLANDTSEDAYFNALREAFHCGSSEYLLRKQEITQSFRDHYEIGICALEYEKLYESLVYNR